MSEYSSAMANVLVNLKAMLLDPTSGLGLTDVKITRVELPAESYPSAQIFPYAVRDSEGDISAKIDVAIYDELVVEETAVLALYDLAHKCAAFLRMRAERIVPGGEIEVATGHDIGERLEPSGGSIEGRQILVPCASFITVTIEPIWLEDPYDGR